MVSEVQSLRMVPCDACDAQRENGALMPILLSTVAAALTLVEQLSPD